MREAPCQPFPTQLALPPEHFITLGSHVHMHAHWMERETGPEEQAQKAPRVYLTRPISILPIGPPRLDLVILPFATNTAEAGWVPWRHLLPRHPTCDAGSHLGKSLEDEAPASGLALLEAGAEGHF